MSRKLNAGVVALLAMTLIETAHADDLATKAPNSQPTADADTAKKAPTPTTTSTPFFTINNNWASVSYQFTATSPGVNETAKTVYNYTHFDAWEYGTNFAYLDLLDSTNRDPVVSKTCCDGSSEFYSFFRSTLGFNQLTHSNKFSYGPLSNISFIAGADLGVRNSPIASQKRAVMGGLDFDFALPMKSIFSISIQMYKEWNHSAFLAADAGRQDFDPTWHIDGSYKLPLNQFWPDVPLTFTTAYYITGAKGAGNPSNQYGTKPEYFVQPKLALDVGQIAGIRQDLLSVWVSYRYWENKFGINPASTCCTLEQTWITGMSIAF